MGSRSNVKVKVKGKGQRSKLKSRSMSNWKSLFEFCLKIHNFAYFQVALQQQQNQQFAYFTPTFTQRHGCLGKIRTTVPFLQPKPTGPEDSNLAHTFLWRLPTGGEGCRFPIMALGWNCCANFHENAPQNYSRGFCPSNKPENLTDTVSRVLARWGVPIWNWV